MSNSPKENNYNEINELSLNFKYIIKENGKSNIPIFNEYFVKNNKDNCYLIINNDECELRSKYDFREKGEHKITLKIYNHQIIDFRSMFNGISNIINISGFSDFNYNVGEDISYMFYSCNNIESFKPLKNLDVSNCKNFEGVFSGCNFSNLDYLSKWDMAKAINLENMFYNCNKLNNINGIKGWKVQNVENFKFMFYGCQNLTNVNSIKNWDMSKAKSIYGMFQNCQNLYNMDSLFRWNLNNIVDKTDIIKGCCKLVNIPSIFEKTPNEKDDDLMYRFDDFAEDFI